MKNNLLKSLDAWTEVLISDPLTNRIAVRLSKIRGIHPLHITAVSQFLKLLGAAFYFSSSDSNMIIPPILFFLGILVDSIDGKVARLTGKSMRIHGSLDFISDQVSNSIFFFSMLIAFGQEKEYFLWMIVWYVILFINMSLTSTRYRLLSFLGGVDADSIEELRGKYDAALPLMMQRRFLKKLYLAYSLLLEKTSKHRLVPHPTEVDSELVFFVIFPILVSMGSPLAFPLLLLSVALLIPTITYSSVLCLALTKYWESKRHADS